MKNHHSPRDSFGSKFGIIAATAGSAVGLGNIWKFPYVAGENGGGAFLLIYLFFVLAVGVPVMMSEFAIGRRGQKNAYGSCNSIAPGKKWGIIGLMGIVAAFFILGFYSAVAGWTLEYTVKMATNSFTGYDHGSLESTFNSFLSNPITPLIWQILFMILTGLVILAGVSKGIEKYSKILMPLLLLFIIILGVRSLTLEGGRTGLEFLFKPDFSKVTPKTFLYAVGQAFFSLSLGMGALMTYSSYFGKDVKLGTTAMQVAFSDTLIAILAGIMIFPAVFAFGIEPGSGPSLVFITLPGIFQQMLGGSFFGAIFFILLAVAALTSTISLLEVVVAFFAEELKLSRRKATVLATTATTILGIFASLSLGILGDFKLFGKSLFDLLDYTASNILLPLGGLLIVLFVGWFSGKHIIKDEISNNGELKVRFYPYYNFAIKFIAPLAIAIVFIYSLFWESLG